MEKKKLIINVIKRAESKKEKGITLVALVITIIIIIILATVTINMAFGKNGLITMAERAKNLTANSIASENEGYNKIAQELENYIDEDNISNADLIIRNKEELLAFRESVNNGENYEGKTILLVADIDISEEEWIPIGNYAEDQSLSFKGIFEGNNHTITGININNEKDYQGFFGYNEGEIKNLHFKDGTIMSTSEKTEFEPTDDPNEFFNAKGSAYIGTVAGINIGGKITGCSSNVKVHGSTIVGGITGYNAPAEGDVSTIENCRNEGEVSCSGESHIIYTGGITGANNGKVGNSTNKGKVTNSGTGDYVYAGGISGYNSDTIDGCNNEGYIENTGIANDAASVGGIAGQSHNTLKEIYISNCNNSGTIYISASATNQVAAGGISGQNPEIVNNCHNSGNVVNQGNSQGIYTGGIVGRQYISTDSTNPMIYLCSNFGEITNKNSISENMNYMGGIIGYNSGNVKKCRNEGKVTNSGTGDYVYTGGISGYNYSVIDSCGNSAIIANTGNATTSNLTGGISGQNNHTDGEAIISNCYNIGNVNVNGTGVKYLSAGGISGHSMKTIYNCYSICDIELKGTATEVGIGGITDFNMTADAKIDLCYYVGNLNYNGEGTKEYTSGITGRNQGTITNCYYLKGTIAGGIDNSDVTGSAEGKEEAYLKSDEFINSLNSNRKENYLEWLKDENSINQGYPYFNIEI